MKQGRLAVADRLHAEGGVVVRELEGRGCGPDAQKERREAHGPDRVCGVLAGGGQKQICDRLCEKLQQDDGDRRDDHPVEPRRADGLLHPGVIAGGIVVGHDRQHSLADTDSHI